MAAACPLELGRVQRLAERLLSADVQVPEPAVVEDVPASLGGAEVEQVFRDHVPGVDLLLFRGKPGCPALSFLVSCYRDGLQAFRGTPLDGHLRSLMRNIVHRGRQGSCSAEDLRELAEGFMDCQAVQARTIERVGFRLCGVAPGFKGLVTRLAGEYKTLAIKMLAVDRLAKGLAKDYDATPTHYENRLTEDLGQRLGLDADSVRLAALDGHASRRFQCLADEDADMAAAHCRELFDTVAMIQAFVAEVNSLSGESPQESISRQFLVWADEHLTDKHFVLDEVTCSRIEINTQMALCIFETLFLGAPAAPEGELHHGVCIHGLFRRAGASAAHSVVGSAHVLACDPAQSPKDRPPARPEGIEGTESTAGTEVTEGTEGTDRVHRGHRGHRGTRGTRGRRGGRRLGNQS